MRRINGGIRAGQAAPIEHWTAPIGRGMNMLLKIAARRAVVRAMRQPLRLNWLLVVLAWTAAGAVLTGLLFLETYYPLPTERLVRFPEWIVYTQFARAMLWVPLTPVVFELRRRIPMRGWRVVPGVLLHACFAATFMMWILTVRIWIRNWYEGDPLEYFSMQSMLDGFAVRTVFDFFIYFGVLGVGALLDGSREMRERAVNEAQLQGRVVEAQLGALRQQMNPHFLHNALNAIAELVRNGENAAAVDAIIKLSALQRALMSTHTDREVRLSEELAFVEKHLELERLRFGDRLKVDIDVARGLGQALVPALVLQPLVENASKHGIARRVGPGSIRVRAAASDGQLELTVENDLPEETSDAEDRDQSSGIGLANLKQRLSRLYPDRNSLVLTIAGPQARAVVQLPLRLAPPP